MLQTETGETFPLEANLILIGRKDITRGIIVDIDLAPFDAGRAISRRHASIERQSNKFYIQDLGSVNGTYLNGQRLPPRQKQPLQNGDVIEFGRGVVRLTFVSKG